MVAGGTTRATSRRRRRTAGVAYGQGGPGAFSEEAALAYFVETNAVACRAGGRSSRAPGRNRGQPRHRDRELARRLDPRTYDLLYEFDLMIVGEVTVAVPDGPHGPPRSDARDIDRVYSPPAGHRPGRRVPAHSARESDDCLQQAALGQDDPGRRRKGRGGGCLGPRRRPYGLTILSRTCKRATRTDPGSRSLPRRAPRGWVRATPSGPRRRPLVFAVAKRAGLAVPLPRGVRVARHNLSSLESRPSRAARWEYVFWADLDAAADAPACADGLEQLRSEAAMVRVLGIPRRAETRAARPTGWSESSSISSSRAAS